eukprot:m.1129856 g.1129856  ORF g.1129856 m.1129856 type:complete len:62 (+) comp24421_c1_seq4:1426-1611(+)
MSSCHTERSVATAICIGTELVVLRFPEIGKYVRIAPSTATIYLKSNTFSGRFNKGKNESAN